MCGRYYIEVSDATLKEIAEEIMRKMAGSPGFEQLSLKLSGEVFPTDIVPVQTALGTYQPMRWGFSGFKAPRSTRGSLGRPIINARSETVLEKPTFRNAVLEHRCLVPASGYYEWKKTGNSKTRYKLYIPGQPVYFAGCYRREPEPGLEFDLPRFVILTQAAASGIAMIHDRMPVAFSPDQAMLWLSEGNAALGQSLQELSYDQA
jgi:putative SOS response-associated peptidase YedK